MLDLPVYEPIDPNFRLDIAAFWLIPDANAPNGHRSVPIPHDVFMAYLDGLSDDE